MKIFVTGVLVPTTNQFKIDDAWTAEKLIKEVIYLAFQRGADPQTFSVVKDGEELARDELLVDHYEDGDEVRITRSA